MRANESELGSNVTEIVFGGDDETTNGLMGRLSFEASETIATIVKRGEAKLS